MEKSITNPFLLQDETVRPAQMELPEELRKKVVILQCESEEGICKVYLVGTTHYSSQSCEDVEAIIGFLKPDLVFLELCETRAHRSKPRDPRPTVVPRFIDVMVAMWKKAKKYGGKVILGDRPIEITNQRTWSKMTFWYRTKFVLIVLFMLAALPLASIHKGANNANNANSANTESIEWHFPSIGETYIHERDLYMASRLFEVAKECKSVVAVVGMGHVAGIQKNWKKPMDIETLTYYS
ncbi:uncharacterized protein LOC131874861 [Cryptomeria japonica]|uniref:uncharacterized protein LOC131874861 n=1 Tax=Cryptomeria japonica TaxID=3369 RepID=UPI0027DA6E6D|nr:uncharacterized protein LOC131874861 [Cryptomeria japonica]